MTFGFESLFNGDLCGIEIPDVHPSLRSTAVPDEGADT